MAISFTPKIVQQTIRNTSEFTSTIAARKTLTTPAVKDAANTLTKAENQKVLDVIKRSTFVQYNNQIKILNRINTPIPQEAIHRRDLFLTTVEHFNLSPKTLKSLKSAKTWGELQAAIFKFEEDFINNELNPILKMVKPKHLSGIPLEIEQMFYKKKNLQDDCVRYLHGLFANPSTNPDVAKIENILKQKYGVETALLNNDIVKAKQILTAVEKATEKGVPIPKEFIITNLRPNSEHLRTVDGSQSTILLRSSMFEEYMKKYISPIKYPDNIVELLKKWAQNCRFKANYSTAHPEHECAHEIMHSRHIPLLSFKTKRIPKKYTSTINSLSGYAAAKPTAAHEIYTELNTKRILEGLTPEEKELFEYLGGKV